MSKVKFKAVTAAATAALAAFSTAPAQSAGVADFYKNKTVTIMVGFGAGGGYGLYARTLSQHMGRHIPGNPNIILQFMTGAGGNKVANYFYTVAPRNGTFLALLANSAALQQVLRPERIRYDVSKLHYLGRMVTMRSAIIVWHNAPATSLADFKNNTLIFGATGKAGQDYMNPTLMKNVLGYKVKMVTGYKGSSAINLAMEKGELHAMANSWGSVKARLGHWLDKKQIVPLAMVGLTPSPDRPDIPLVLDMAKNETDRQILELMASTTAVGRAFTTTPAIPADRLAALLAAFDKTMKDPIFLADVTKRKMELEYMSGPDVQKIINKTIATPKALVESFKKAVEF
ncbi:MAG: tripartite tricarboxylate transporter substrate-binding protein [Proteobacteria bacterium]|nr:tripartite tricarboxylate transporter substrate-binding protein [Pseudomonadota bacterium]